MNLPELVTRVTTIFGDESEVVVMVDDIVRWANDGQLALARRTELLGMGTDSHERQRQNSIEITRTEMWRLVQGVFYTTILVVVVSICIRFLLNRKRV